MGDWFLGGWFSSSVSGAEVQEALNQLTSGNLVVARFVVETIANLATSGQSIVTFEHLQFPINSL
jgi:hypothetical protein